jgi:hypothetical protein
MTKYDYVPRPSLRTVSVAPRHGYPLTVAAAVVTVGAAVAYRNARNTEQIVRATGEAFRDALAVADGWNAGRASAGCELYNQYLPSDQRINEAEFEKMLAQHGKRQLAAQERADARLRWIRFAVAMCLVWIGIAMILVTIL